MHDFSQVLVMFESIRNPLRIAMVAHIKPNDSILFGEAFKLIIPHATIQKPPVQQDQRVPLSHLFVIKLGFPYVNKACLLCQSLLHRRCMGQDYTKR